jgi:hypothetical protein
MGRSGGGIRRQPERRQDVAAEIDVDDWSWFAPVADELRMLDRLTAPSWRTEVAERMDVLAAKWEADVVQRCLEPAPGITATVDLAPKDVRMLAQVAMELGCEEDPRALAKGAATWRTLAASDLSSLVSRLRVE